MTFKDHFSGHAHDYARFRPHYPTELFAWIAAAAPATDCAWDCACGSGQASVQLSRCFARVVATDASARQVAAASAPANVSFRVASAERSGLPAASIDAICVAQALHWFDVAAFYAEAQRVARPGAVVAVWTYGSVSVDGIDDALLSTFEHKTVGAYWPPERRWIDTRYARVTLPGDPLAPPSFTMTADWTLAHTLGYVESWSSVRRCRAATGHDPMPDLARQLASHWGDPGKTRRVRWPLTVLAARLATFG